MSVNSTGDYSTALVEAILEPSSNSGQEPPADPRPLPPVAKKIRCEHEAHGEKRPDDYHWLRNKEDPDTIPYLEEWNAYTSRMMEPLKPLTDTLYHEFLGRMEANSKSVPYQLGAYLYYVRMEEGKDYPIFCRTPAGEEAEQVLLDGNVYASAVPYFAVKAMEPSPDGRYVAYTIDTDGSQFGKIVIFDTQLGKFLDEEIENSNGCIVWNSRSDCFWYTRVNEEFRADRAYVHTVGKKDSDLLVREEADPLYDIHLDKDKHDRYLILTSSSKETSEVSIGSLDHPAEPFVLIHAREQGLKYFLVPGDQTHYILVSKDKANWGLYQAPHGQIAKENWVEVIPSTPDVDLVGVEVFKDYLAVLKRVDGLKQVEIRSFVDGLVHEVVMPQAIGDIDFEHNDGWDTPLLRFTFDSPVTPLATYHYDMGARSLILLKQKKAGDFNPDLYTSERILASADDGTQVPISLFYMKGLKRDGSEPLYLYGYGSYGVTYDPYFSGINASFLERGVCFAIAHVRGGGDLGRQWYQQGSMMNKRNTFTDFINCAEHLIKQGYTSPERLGIGGGSAGGLLMGAVVNMRPDLFKVCMAKVPFVDVVTTMFDESLPLTTQEWVEWGNPNQLKHYQYMKGYSPYDNVEAKSYPAMLVGAGLNDKQVSYHEPAKWVAKLMEFKTDDNPLLFRVNMGAGHHGASGRYAAYGELAPEIAFVLDQLGFQV
jgi:oligopeptidase B